MIRWGAPYFLHLFWAFIPLAWLLFHLSAKKRNRLRQLVHPENMAALAPNYQPRRAIRALCCRTLALALFIVALARPQWGFFWEEVSRHGLDIMVVLDTSRSMLAEDIPPKRMQQAKWGVHDLVQRLRGDRIGLVAFAGTAHIQCPLTSDYGAFLMALDDVHVGLIPRGGTAIGLALDQALEAFASSESQADKVIILITDGEDHHRDLTRWIPTLEERGIRVYAIGIGTLEGDLIPVLRDGQQDFVKDDSGQVVQTRLNEQVLQRLALETGGIYVRAGPGDFGLDQIYDRSISQLVRDDQETRRLKVYEDRYAWFLLAALFMLVLEAILGGKNPLRKPVIPLLLLALLLPRTALAARTPDDLMREGLKRYEQAEEATRQLADPDAAATPEDTNTLQRIESARQDYTGAAELFSLAAGLATQDDKLDPAVAYYNLGNAQYRLGDLAEAREAYGKALKTTDISLLAHIYFNLGNCRIQEYFSRPPETFEEHIARLTACLEPFEQALMLDPGFRDAKVNHEMLQRLIQRLLDDRIMVGYILAEVKELVRQGEIRQAAENLQHMLQRPELMRITEMVPESAKEMEELRGKVEEVLDIDLKAETGSPRILQEENGP